MGPQMTCLRRHSSKKQRSRLPPSWKPFFCLSLSVVESSLNLRINGLLASPWTRIEYPERECPRVNVRSWTTTKKRSELPVNLIQQPGGEFRVPQGTQDLMFFQS